MAWIRKPRQAVFFSPILNLTTTLRSSIPWEQSLEQCFRTPTSSPTQTRKQWKLCRTHCFHPISYAGWAIQECKHCSPGDYCYEGRSTNPLAWEETAWTHWKKVKLKIESCRWNQELMKTKIRQTKNFRSTSWDKLLSVHVWEKKGEKYSQKNWSVCSCVLWW